MPRNLLPAIALVLVLLSAATPLAGGDIYVGGPWGTRIDRLPYTITEPGAYYLGGNLTYTGSGDGITVAPGVSHVTLDLMGFTVNGSGSGRYGIYLNGNHIIHSGDNVEIRNGTVTGWRIGITENSIYSGELSRVINVRAVGNSTGILLTGAGYLIQGCEVTGTGSNTAISISSGIVSQCMVRFLDGSGINTWNGGRVSDNVVLGTGNGVPRCGISVDGTGTLIKGNKVSGCATGISCNSYGLNVIGNTVDAASGTTGIFLTDDFSNLEDQNTVTGAGTRYNANYTQVQRRTYY
jgi:hypothetical protein